MDTQPNSMNMESPEVMKSGTSPEQMRPNETVVPSSEVGSAAASPPAARLSAADVAAAIAAVPNGSATPVSASAPTPIAANDVDLIEPEWVAKAEDVVAKHQGDPYGEEEAVEALQQEYLQQRYGHTVASPNKPGLS